MRYWLFDGQSARGPYAAEELKRMPGFGLEAVVAPEDAQSAEAWKPAGSFPELKVLFVPPPPARRARAPAQTAKPEPSEDKTPIELQCSKCGQDAPVGAYCIHCGSRIGAPRGISLNPRMAIALIIVGVVAAAAALWMRSGQTSKATMDLAKAAAPGPPEPAVAPPKNVSKEPKAKPIVNKPAVKKAKKVKSEPPLVQKEPQKPAPNPAPSQDASGGQRKSVADMTPQELEKYLKRQTPSK